MKNIKKIAVKSMFFLTFLLVSCDNFDEINRNPDAATNPSPSMICTNVILKNIKFNGREIGRASCRERVSVCV